MNADLQKTINNIDKFLNNAGILSHKKFKRKVVLKAGLIRTKGIKIKREEQV